MDNGVPMDDYLITRVKDVVPEEARLEQLAEECVELAKAALKKARKLRGENYTPKTIEEINADISEEYTDVRIAAQTCGLEIDWPLREKKLMRWIKRNTEDGDIFETN